MESKVKLRKLIIFNSYATQFLFVSYLILMIVSIDKYFNIFVFITIVTTYTSQALLMRHINKNFCYLLYPKKEN